MGEERAGWEGAMSGEDPRQRYIDEIAKCQEERGKINERLFDIRLELSDCYSKPESDAKEAKIGELENEKGKLEGEARILTRRIEVAELALEKAEE